MMKKLIYIIVFSIFLLYACGGNSSKTEKEDSIEGSIENVEKSKKGEKEDEKVANCDDFLKQYEEWVDEYLKLLDDYMKNPMDATLSEKYMKVAQEAGDWIQKWSNFYSCAAKEKYQKRFDEISKKIEKKMKELDID